jgi:shikimate dehydrogenase
MTHRIDKGTQLCMSLSGRPGNFGMRFHNYLYEKLGLNFIYKAFTTSDLRSAIGGIRALGIRGCAVSMPFKEACIEFLDELDVSAKGIQSVNTIVNDAGFLRAYNTDYIAVAELLARNKVAPAAVFVLRGSGGMAKAVACALYDAGFRRGYIAARNEATGRALADRFHYEWRAELNSIYADLPVPDLLVNATPVGMAGGPEADDLAFSEEAIGQAQTVFDVVALPAETPLIRSAKAKGKQVISGADVIVIQAVEQFVLYTGVRPSPDLVRRAADFALVN